MKKSLGAITLVYPTPVWLIGTYDRNAKPNAATVAWGGICSSDPPSVAISLRPSRYTYENIINRNAFTVNIPSVKLIAEADYCGIVSGRKVDKFQETGLAPVRGQFVDAPGIAECPLILECELSGSMEIGVHVHMIGRIVDVQAEESMLQADGTPDILLADPPLYAPESKDYYGVGRLLGKAYSIGRDIKSKT